VSLPVEAVLPDVSCCILFVGDRLPVLPSSFSVLRRLEALCIPATCFAFFSVGLYYGLER
jgi:hypothetical protein